MLDGLVGLLFDPLAGTLRRFGGAAPAFLAAFTLLLLGMFAARAARAAIDWALGRLRLDELTSRIGVNEVLARLGLGKSPTEALSFVVHWFILFVFIVSAAEAMDLGVVKELLERFVARLPSLVAALLVVFGGLLFARFLGHIVRNAATANSIRGGAAVALVAQAVCVGAASITALEQLGVRAAILVSAAQILIGSLGLSIAIAVGFGAKDLAAEFLRDLVSPRR